MDKNITFNTTIASVYVLMLSTSYLWGFWGHFNINILNYIGVTDIIKATIIPMIIALAMYLTQVAMGVFNSPKPNSIENFSSKGRAEKFDIILRYSYIILIASIMLASVIYNIINGSKMQRYASIGWFLATAIYFTTFTNSKILEFIPLKNKVLPYAMICYLPIVFLHRGVYEGDRIQSGKDTFLIESNSICSSDNKNKYRFIDSIGDKVFALSLKDNSICIFKYEYLKLIKEKQINDTK